MQVTLILYVLLESIDVILLKLIGGHTKLGSHIED